MVCQDGRLSKHIGRNEAIVGLALATILSVSAPPLLTIRNLAWNTKRGRNAHHEPRFQALILCMSNAHNQDQLDYYSDANNHVHRYGTYDHLILLLGRLASFSSKDLSRKRKAFRSRSGSFKAGSSPSQFPGIVPTNGKFHAPMGFNAPSSSSEHSDSPDDSATPESNESAEHEWESIRQAFETFEKQLDSRFKPLNSEYADRKETPFGSALQYRTYSVAGIWMNYYMGLIHLHRSRPNMPPAAMQAAQMAAPSTAGYAIQIGRIAAGLTDDLSRKKDISTTLAAGFIESSFCLFVAAVQVWSLTLSLTLFEFCSG